jgi:hypothetical protein
VSDPHADLVESSAPLRFEAAGSTAYEMMRLETYSDPLDLIGRMVLKLAIVFSSGLGARTWAHPTKKSADLKLASPRRASFFVLLTRPCLLPG